MSTPYPIDIHRLEFWVLAIVGGAAAIQDLARRTISNWLSLAALLAGLACQMVAEGWKGAGMALLGSIAGFVIFLVFYLLGGMGGGDVKLMAGFGSMLGVGRLLQAAIWIGIAGGLMAAAALGYSALRRALSGNQGKAGRAQAIPYAPAIVIGVWLTLLSGK